MKTNLKITDEKIIYDILVGFPLKGIYYDGEYGMIDTRFEKISPIYLDALSRIINKMKELAQNGMSLTDAFHKAVFDSTRLDILEDYSQGFINQQQLSDYLKDSYKDEELASGVQINDVYIR